MSAAEKIAALNDAFRTTFVGGHVHMTNGVARLSDGAHELILDAVRGPCVFGRDNDPHGERDFGAFTVAGDKFFWKIDYYDAKMEFGSEDPSDPTQTTRVLTIMLAREY